MGRRLDRGGVRHWRRGAGRAVAAALLAGCGGGTSPMPSNSQFIDGFDPPAANAGEMAVVSPIVKDIQPGADITLCSYLDVKF